MLKHILFPPVLLPQNKVRRVVEDKTILITGASFGIGKELALYLSEFQTHLILVARTKDKLDELKELVDSKNSTSEVYAVDLRNENERIEFINCIKNSSVDFLILNAGKSIRRPLLESLDRFHDVTRTNDINYLAPVHLMLGLIPSLAQTKGKVINVSAINVLYPPPPFWSVYQASKTAFDQWFRANEIELNKLGISTSTIYFPLVRTRMIEPNEKYQKVPAMSPVQAAKRIAKLMSGRRRSYKPWWHYIIVPFVWFFFPIYRLIVKAKLK